MTNGTSSESSLTKTLNKLTETSTNVLNELNLPISNDATLEFTGYLVYEDKDTINIADLQGTWAISKTSVINIQDLKSNVNLTNNDHNNRFVKVSIRDGSIIHEIRPWKISIKGGKLGGKEFKQSIEKVFALGGTPLPIGEKTIQGEKLLADLERNFARRIGQNVEEDSLNNTNARGPSKTIVIVNGMCDADCGF